MPERPIIVFDVNETLLNLEAICPVFDRVFNDPAGPQPNYVGEDLDVLADQLIARYPAAADGSRPGH
jgi:hypothetical protein